MKLFDYQLEFKSAIQKAFRKEKRIVGQLPTGAGKTIVMADIICSAISKNKRPCIVVHREEIFQQTFKALRSFGVTPGIIAAGHKISHGHSCYLGMVETVCRRMNKGMICSLGIDFWLMDEVHWGSYWKLIENIDTYILGLTATPKSSGAKGELNEQFGDIVCGIPVKELIQIGRLVPAKTYSIQHDFSKVKKRGRDFDESALLREFKKAKLWDGAVKEYLRLTPGQKALCYSVNVEQSKAVCEQFKEAGYKAVHVDGTTNSDERDAMFKMHKAGDVDILCNVGIATTGYDDPSIEVIIENYATMQLTKEVQVRGRGARCYPGKKRFTIIDMGRNYIRHGKFYDEKLEGDDIDWKEIFHNPSKAITKDKKKTQRECDECGAVIKMKLQSCPYCGDFISQKEVENIMIKEGLAEEVKQYRLQTLPVTLRRHPRDMNFKELKEFAHHMGYHYKWVYKMKQVYNIRG